MEFSVELDSSSPVPDGDDITMSESSAGDVPRFVGHPMIEQAARWEQLSRGFEVAARLSPSVVSAINMGVSAHRREIQRAVLPQIITAVELVRQQTQLVGIGAQLAAQQQAQVAAVGAQLAAAFRPQLQFMAGISAQLAVVQAQRAQVAAVGAQLAAAFQPQHLQYLQQVGLGLQVAAARQSVFTSRMFEVAEALSRMPVLRWVSEVAERAVQAGFDIGMRLHVALLAARDAAVRGDAESVAQFLDQWMELPRSKRRARVQAGMDVLVLEPIDDCTPATAFDVLDRLEQRLRHHYERCCVPFGDTTLAGRRVVHLEALSALSGNRSVDEFLPAAPSAEDWVAARLDPVEDERLLTLMVGLSDTERAVMLTWGDGRMSWQQAALTCRLPESDGERVRAKLMRRARVLRRVAPGGWGGGPR